ncbi:uncharacterized protein N7469_011285 [Penicillium citrinum]|uniref:Uncharacterized protein n=2 Tax=Penicillium TaxID=5073 RepID=A0A9W9ND48_PENCI|nr:uncharacterized protein N7469_011285 [Penicillium citrinum]KAJ5217660.1 hypothetical protein N7469_011285 [Penicillium citrinum]KAJ5575458.1 hypothetical protein N7450_009357 [Penicillium hetheringtonii]
MIWLDEASTEGTESEEQNFYNWMFSCFSTVSRHWFVIYYGFTPNLKGVVFGKFLFPKEEAPA